MLCSKIKNINKSQGTVTMELLSGFLFYFNKVNCCVKRIIGRFFSEAPASNDSSRLFSQCLMVVMVIFQVLQFVSTTRAEEYLLEYLLQLTCSDTSCSPNWTIDQFIEQSTTEIAFYAIRDLLSVILLCVKYVDDNVLFIGITLLVVFVLWLILETLKEKYDFGNRLVKAMLVSFRVDPETETRSGYIDMLLQYLKYMRTPSPGQCACCDIHLYGRVKYKGPRNENAFLCFLLNELLEKEVVDGAKIIVDEDHYKSKNELRGEIIVNIRSTHDPTNFSKNTRTFDERDQLIDKNARINEIMQKALTNYEAMTEDFRLRMLARANEIDRRVHAIQQKVVILRSHIARTVEWRRRFNQQVTNYRALEQTYSLELEKRNSFIFRIEILEEGIARMKEEEKKREEEKDAPMGEMYEKNDLILRRGILMEGNGNYNVAIRMFQESASLNPSRYVFEKLGQMYEHLLDSLSDEILDVKIGEYVQNLLTSYIQVMKIHDDEDSSRKIMKKILKYSKKYCCYCGKDNRFGKLKKCTNCEVIRCCSDSCHKKSWKLFHWKKCRVLRKLHTRFYRDQ